MAQQIIVLNPYKNKKYDEILSPIKQPNIIKSVQKIKELCPNKNKKLAQNEKM